jgi:DNA-binding NtrC family response regulator
MVEADQFRSDLFHRISTFPIRVPALVERQDDIPLLADSFLKRVAGDRQLHMTRAALAALERRKFSGNIRELRNIIERATILADGDAIEAAHFEAPALMKPQPEQRNSGRAADVFVVEQPVALAELEGRYLRWVAERLPGDRSAQAAALKLGKRTFYRKLKATAG